MPEPATATATAQASDAPAATATAQSPDWQLPVGHRVRAGLRRPANWVALVRFSVVGASGYVLNLAAFALAVHRLGLDYHLAAAVAFLLAVGNNFAWNRRWTFAACGGHAGFQAARFLAVSAVTFGFSLLVLDLLVSAAGLPRVPAQAAAIALATPLSFLGNKLWSFAA